MLGVAWVDAELTVAGRRSHWSRVTGRAEREGDAIGGDLVSLPPIQLPSLVKRAGGLVGASGMGVDVGERAQCVSVKVDEVGSLGSVHRLRSDHERFLVGAAAGESFGVGATPLHLGAEVIGIGVLPGDV